MEETAQQEVQIPNSFDDFVQGIPEENDKTKTEEVTLDKKLAGERLEWTNKIISMSEKMKKLPDLAVLQTIVYTERQRAVEYYHYLLSLISYINKGYRKKFAEKYDYYTYQSQKRFPNERVKELQIMAELGDTMHKKEQIENHSKFMDKTISTIDNIIYGIKSRLEIEQFLSGR
jgi:hypothetical protein